MANNKNSNFNKISDDLYCRYCGKQCKNLNSLKQHECRCPKNKDRKESALGFTISRKKGTWHSWNKGLTKETDPRVLINSIHCSEAIRGENNPFYGKHHTSKSKNKISSTMCEVVNFSDKHYLRSKKGYYKGIYCASSYELIYLVYCLDHSLNICRDSLKVDYVNYAGVYHKYIPDFYLPDQDTHVEIKGVKSKDVELKAAAMADYNYIILYESDLKDMWEYCKYKYNVNNYIELCNLLYD